MPLSGTLDILTSVLYIDRMPANLKQRCFMAFIYASWLVLAAMLAVLVWKGLYAGALAALVCLPLAQWLYIRHFRRLAPWMGYGPITDEPAGALLPAAQVNVTLYTALGCPFCPLIEQRLDALRKTMGFQLEKIDVTLKPALLAAKGIRSVPVVEVGDRHLIGLVSTRELEEAIRHRAEVRA